MMKRHLKSAKMGKKKECCEYKILYPISSDAQKLKAKDCAKKKY